MVFIDAQLSDKPIIFANDSFLHLTGYDRDEVLGQSLHFMMASGTDSDMLAKIKTASGNHAAGDPEICCRRKNGSLFWVTIFISPVRDRSGDVIQHFASFADVTDRKRETDRLRFLLDELNHRTQNTLATVQAIAAQTFQGAADREAVTAFNGRILALSKVHALLGRRNWDSLNLRDVIEQILEPFGLHDGLIPRFTIEGDNVRLPPKTTLSLAMMFHELATNASKYGALSPNAAGKVDIAWQVETTPQGDRIRLRWQENGGPLVMPPAHSGFGSRLIERGLAQELNGEVRLDYDPEGVVCQIVMPVPVAGGWDQSPSWFAGINPAAPKSITA
jgi:PAS domain S-box-containing protein